MTALDRHEVTHLDSCRLFKRAKGEASERAQILVLFIDSCLTVYLILFVRVFLVPPYFSVGFHLKYLFDFLEDHNEGWYIGCDNVLCKDVLVQFF